MEPDGRFRSALLDALARWGVALTDAQAEAMARQYTRMVEKNRSTNLTRITDPVEAAVKHYADSLSLLLWEKREEPAIRTLLDIGTGAGFPALPLAIARPAWVVTALDGTRKKVDFLQTVVSELAMENLTPVWAHSDHWEPPHRYDLVVFRALGPLDESLARAASLVATGGWIIAYKTAELSADERRIALEAVPKLGLREAEPLRYELKVGDDVLARRLLVYRKSTS